LLLAFLLAFLLSGILSCQNTPSELDESQLREAARLRSVALADMEDGDYGSAAVNLEKLASILPDNILPPINLAICYFRLNRNPDALREIERARRLDPDNPQMLYTFARLLEMDQANASLWRELVDHFATVHPADPGPFYLQARRHLEARQFAEAVPVLKEALVAVPENLVLLADLLVAAAVSSDPESTIDALNAIEDRLSGFEGNMADYADRIRELVDAGKTDALRPAAHVMQNLLRPTELYGLHLVPLIGSAQTGGGLFPQHDFDPPLPKSIQGGQDITMTFEEASFADVIPAPVTSWAVTSPEPGRETLLAATANGLVEVYSHGDDWRSFKRMELAPEGLMLSCDIDQDGMLDLVTASVKHGVLLRIGLDDGLFGPPIAVFDPADGDVHTGLFPLDVDHEGDLDLFVTRVNATDLYLQNNGDGSWTERAKELGIAGASATTTDMVSADFDDDGDLDLLTVHPGGHPRLYLNRRSGAFDDATTRLGLDQLVTDGYTATRTADFNNDGRFDLLMWDEVTGTLLLNQGSGYEATSLPQSLDVTWSHAQVGDYDNDGDQDFVVVAGDKGELLLVRNRRQEAPPDFVVEPTGLSLSGATGMITADLDRDGDLDLAARFSDNPPRAILNQGGNRNHWVRLNLKGKNDNNAKNNVQGMFCRIEARVGDSFQVILGNGGVNHLGLGSRRVADVIRVVWTNGLAQTRQLASADQSIVEEQVLKGSCPFLYTWNGDDFEFVTDLMWRSPLGMILADGGPAPHQSARDFVLIPQDKLRPVDGELWLQITEELWETAYVDRNFLLAVDHPADVDLVVDEKFSPPPYSREPALHWLAEPLRPVAARDQNGQDVLARLQHRDGSYVDALPLGRYQGLTDGHFVDLSFEGVPTNEPLHLVLWGWTFPTDTSINFALSQDASRSLQGPSLEMIGENGDVSLVSPFIGFPNGKRKAMVVDLGDSIPSGDVTLRVATSMQIYWDAVVLAYGEPSVATVVTRLEPRSADLHYRGYSRLYRDSPSGPHLFDYPEVEAGPRFRDMRGSFTRYGSVVELLEAEDDDYVVMNAGDELTLVFDASVLPDLPEGWRREYVLYSDGWVKDADLHTVFSQTVEPLPFHGMEGYPAVDGKTANASRYQTRIVSDVPFRDALKAVDE
jgi:hypothetical protein